MAALRLATHLTAPHDATRISTERGSIAYWELRPDLYATEVQGHMTLAMAALIISRGDRLYARHNPVYGFHNWLAMTSYDSACRTDLTAWVLRNRASTVLHIAVVSRIVAMGVTVANLALGNLIQVHNSLEKLERELARVRFA